MTKIITVDIKDKNINLYPRHVNISFKERAGYPNRISVMFGDKGAGKSSILREVTRATANEAFTAKSFFSSVAYVPFSFSKEFYETKAIYCGNDCLDKYDYCYDIIRCVEAFTDKEYKFLKSLLKSALGCSHIRFLRALSASSAVNFRKLYDFSAKELMTVLGIAKMVSLKNVLICMDSPEAVVSHDNMYGFINALYDFLEKTDSYALIATNSPEIISDTLAEHCIWLSRCKNPVSTIWRIPPEETFGMTVADVMFSFMKEEDISIMDKHPRLALKFIKKRIQDEGYDTLIEENPQLSLYCKMQAKQVSKGTV